LKRTNQTQRKQRKKVIKIKGEINKIESKLTKQKISKAQNWFFES
jgi:hypothetical protein